MSIGIGIQLGPTTLQAVVLERSNEQLKLVAAHETACDTSNAQALTRALTDLRTRLHLAKKPIVLGVPSTSTILTTLHPLIVAPRRAALAIQFELQQQLPFDLTDAMWHYHWFSNGKQRSRLKARGSRQGPPASGLQPSASGLQRAPMVVAAAMRRSLLDERLASCRRAGLSVRAVVANPVATVNLCCMARPTTPRGRHSAPHALFRFAKQSETRGAPPAGPPTLTLLTLHDDQTAEWIVSTTTQLQAIPVTSSSPDTLWQDVATSWQALHVEDTTIPTPVWVLGSVEATSRVQGVLTDVPVKRFELPPAIKTGSVRLEAPERTVAALGLALQGLGIAEIPLNLLADVQRDAWVRKTRRISTIVSGVVVAVTLVLGLSGMLDVRHRRVNVLRVLEARESLYQSLRPEAKALIKEQHRIEQRGLQLEQFVQDAPMLTQLIAQVTDAMPEAIWLMTFESSKSGLLHGLLEGHATSFQDVTKFMEQLKQVARMTTVKPLSTKIVTDTTLGRELIAFALQIQRPLHLEEEEQQQDSP